MDLFDTPPPDRAAAAGRVLSVAQLTRRIRDALERGLGSVRVEGEISNHRRQTSGHHYFTLKDSEAQLSCVLFRSQAQQLREPLTDGARVIVSGEISVYEARGQYQMIVRRVEMSGQGDLQAKYEALKRRLHAEGLFDPDRKKPIPRLPLTVALITSPTGAAVQDMLHILTRRAPWLHVLVVPVRVQGAGAAEEIAAALHTLSRAPAGLPRIDTVVVTRGGGSLEDLWAFNEEIVARAIAACPLPVISAVGHEIDFTIADFAADLRAPTPSAAAELLTPDREELLARLAQTAQRLQRRTQSVLDQHRRVLDLTVRGALQRDAERLLLPWRQRVDEAAQALPDAIDSVFTALTNRLRDCRHRLEQKRPDRILAERSAALQIMRERLTTRAATAIDRHAARLRERTAQLKSLGPDSVLARGFSCTLDAAGRPVTDAATLKPGDEFTTRLARGQVRGVVRETS